MTPTEHEMTVAVEGAARRAYAAAREVRSALRPDLYFPPWEGLYPLEVNRFREMYLPMVVAALEALPDRAEAERIRIGTYLTEDMWCHHERCLHMKGEDCSCGLDELLEQFEAVAPK